MTTFLLIRPEAYTKNTRFSYLEFGVAKPLIFLLSESQFSEGFSVPHLLTCLGCQSGFQWQSCRHVEFEITIRINVGINQR